MQTLSKFIPEGKVHRLIILLTVWQFVSIALMSVGTWPANMAILNTLLLAAFVVAFKPYYSVLLLILSIPFYIVLPNTVVPNIPMWRVLFALLFLVWLIHLLVKQRQWLLKLLTFQRASDPTQAEPAKFRDVILNAYERMDSRFMPWDKVAVIFLVIALLSLIVARFPLHGFKQILFLVNIYIFYIVIINVVTDAQKVRELIRYTIYSLGIMVLLGYIQYFATLFAQPYYFWQYWATLVSSLYYGQPFADVLTYSNSWFSYSGGTQALRMFGILPDTHAFGVIAIFFLAFLVPYVRTTALQAKDAWQDMKNTKWYYLAAIVAAAFAVMANGTRGIWVAMLVPLGIAGIFAYNKIFSKFSYAMLAVYAIVVSLFILSPFISMGMNFIRTVDVNDNFLDRASSIYDLKESSNVGRLEIWKSSLKFGALHPFGVGYGNFIVSIVPRIADSADYEDLAQMENLRYNLPQKFITAHSLYLQLVVELGFAGLLAFILFWIEYYQKFWKFLSDKLDKPHFYTKLTASLALTILWLLVYGFFDLTILNDRVLQYLFISLAVSGLVFAKYPGLKEETAQQNIE